MRFFNLFELSVIIALSIILGHLFTIGDYTVAIASSVTFIISFYLAFFVHDMFEEKVKSA